MNTIREIYKTNKRDAFYAYIGFLQIYAHDIKLTEFTDGQIADILMAIENEEVLLLRTRRGGKTRDLTVLAVFWSIVNLRPIWFSVERDQKHQPKQWLYMNPFVVNVTGEFIEVLNRKYKIPFSALTKGKSASKGADCAIYDEGGKIDLNHEKYDYYLYSRAIVSESKELHIVHASTASLGTVEYLVYTELMGIDPSLVSTRTWRECPWLSEAFIESERAKHPEDPWYILQEYECMHVPRGGALLVNVVVCEESELPPTEQWGVDIGKTFQFVGTTINHDWTRCWVTDEKELDYYTEHEKIQMRDIFRHYPVEIEDGGFNYHPARMLADEVNLRRSEWKKEIKSERLGIARTFKTIYVCPAKTPNTYRDLIESIYHKLHPIWLKDNQHPCHFLDAFMHSLGAKPVIIYHITPSTNRVKKDRVRELMRLRAKNKR